MPTTRSPLRARWEWPTWLLWITILGAWVGSLVQATRLGQVLSFCTWVLLIAWYMSLQHELIHGHPTRLPWLNRLLGLWPLGLWYPYDLYKTLHLAHHRDAVLTHPHADPESNYHYASTVRGRWHHALLRSQRTVAGRITLGPALTIVHVARACARDFQHPQQPAMGQWLQHLALTALLLGAIGALPGVTVWAYGLASYAALGLSMVRSLYEHRPATRKEHRIVINEAALPWRLLFLNNTYHAVHHALPGMAWYRIGPHYRAHRATYLAGNGGFLVPGYGWLFRHHFLQAIDSPILHDAA